MQCFSDITKPVFSPTIDLLAAASMGVTGDSISNSNTECPQAKLSVANQSDFSGKDFPDLCRINIQVNHLLVSTR